MEELVPEWGWRREKGSWLKTDKNHVAVQQQINRHEGQIFPSYEHTVPKKLSAYQGRGAFHPRPGPDQRLCPRTKQTPHPCSHARHTASLRPPRFHLLVPPVVLLMPKCIPPENREEPNNSGLPGKTAVKMKAAVGFYIVCNWEIFLIPRRSSRHSTGLSVQHQWSDGTVWSSLWATGSATGWPGDHRIITARWTSTVLHWRDQSHRRYDTRRR